jgi:hypothetical protein
MFKKLFEGAAAKASLVNLKFDLDELATSFPHSPTRASEALFSLLENSSLALSDNASEEELQQTAASKSSSYSPVLRDIVTQLVQLSIASRRGDTVTVNACDSRINDLFASATGAPLNTTQLSAFARFAMKSQGDAPQQPR